MKTIILCGGKGTRLWPLSREQLPKQFIKIFDDKSLFQRTVERATLFSAEEEIFIVTNKDYKFRVLDELKEIKISIPERNILLEPSGKNTLPAIYLGIKKISEIYGDCNVQIVPSDHIINANETYIEAFKTGENLANSELVTFGIKPTSPHTGYGYIGTGERTKKGNNACCKVSEFKEKPDLETAKKYVREGYLWNSGMFIFNTKIFTEAIRKLTPEIYTAFESSGSLAEIYKKIPEISVDYGIIEKAKNVYVVPLNTSWNDLGSFDAIYDVYDKDEDGNAGTGERICIDSSKNLVITKRLTALVGVENLSVIDSDDALLIAKRGETEKVKEIFKILKNKGDERAITDKTSYRPWGQYTVLEDGERYKIKHIVVLPKKRLSLQMHYHRSEHWIVVRGMAKIVVDGKEMFLRNGESTFIPSGFAHRLENPGKVILEIMEVQIGEYLGEDDIERFEVGRGKEKV
ncbi:MAG: mannose-1-phosphate guanylyltransferase/mannose-6-phosphate isomerase [Candidatus Altiarchaeales archaeon A3]|nr:MAG: mannose-1-phosphate guanylyltransferase/mannose-6-phosphate isomerase [Candidatus Altiarchaeales archaeon A3]